ncbi:MAG TPA: ABC transporter permease [Candidatus Binatia bacterium]|nr:ABC transporter permease [Candidatus Binatia bacterium]
MLLALALRELRRRAVRSALTAVGIAIGVAALILLGALSEKMGRLVAGGRDFATGQITVSGAGTGAVTGMTRGGLLSGDQLEAVRAVPGVDAVAPIVMFPLSDAPAAMPFTMTPFVFGVDLGALVRNHANRHVPPPAVRAGRLVPAPGSDEVVLGSEVARLYGAAVGATFPIRGRDFRVVGVLDPTFTGPDSLVFMPFETAERLLVDSEPLLRRLVLVPGARVLPIATAAAVFWTTGTDPTALAARIGAAVPGLTVLSPAEAARQVDRALAVLDGLIVGSAVVALLVASLAVANTMFTAVVERRREIGIKRAVGATRRQVIRQFVCEAAVLGAAGSLLGLAGGAAGVVGLNSLTARLGATAFLITARLVIAAAILPAGLAALAGLWPAWRAARISPSEAIRWG